MSRVQIQSTRALQPNCNLSPYVCHRTRCVKPASMFKTFPPTFRAMASKVTSVPTGKPSPSSSAVSDNSVQMLVPQVPNYPNLELYLDVFVLLCGIDHRHMSLLNKVVRCQDINCLAISKAFYDQTWISLNFSCSFCSSNTCYFCFFIKSTSIGDETRY